MARVVRWFSRLAAAGLITAGCARPALPPRPDGLAVYQLRAGTLAAPPFRGDTLRVCTLRWVAGTASYAGTSSGWSSAPGLPPMVEDSAACAAALAAR